MPSRIISYRDAASFRPERFHASPVAQSERVKVLVVSFEPGQFIPVHHPGVDLTLVILEGEGRVAAGDREQPVAAGTVVFVPAGEARGVKADTRLVAVSVVSPPPGPGDHDEVAAGLRAGTWRP
ncbi:MAG TPA: cupin domain-containing protein [Vicinamibacterales bacterium]|nr:cupin domain-containing protein [Vicinamibacterales bacterium]